MRTWILITLGLLLNHTSLIAQQVGIGTTQPHSSAILDVQSNNRGFLPPRLTKAQRDQIQQPTVGLVVYCTDCCGVGELQVYQNNSWKNVTGGISCSVMNVTTDSIRAIQSTSFRAHGTVLEHGEPVNARGFIIDTIPIVNPSNYMLSNSLYVNHVITDTVSPDGFTVGLGPFQKNLQYLIPGKTYHVRAWAANAWGGSGGWGFGNNLTVATSSASMGINQGLVAHYAMNGNALDSSGNGHHATVINAVLGADRFGRPNRAYEFNGINNYLECPSGPQLNDATQMTVTAWVRIRGYNTNTNCLSGGGCWQFFVSRDQVPNYESHFSLAFYQDSSAPVNQRFAGFLGASGTSISAAQANPLPHAGWFHLAMVYDGEQSQVRFYVNGILQRTSSRYHNPSSTGKIQIGRYLGATANYFTNGWIDDVRIYNRALAVSEIQVLANLPY
jgi:hypothetical protein